MSETAVSQNGVSETKNDGEIIETNKPETEKSSDEKLISEIIKPVDHTLTEKHSKAEVPEKLSTEIISPVDHTDDGGYEPIQRRSLLIDTPAPEVKPEDLKDVLQNDKLLVITLPVEDEEKKIPPLGQLNQEQSMSVEEERSYMDKKLMKTTSLGEDYTQWSKLNDHEYEPISGGHEPDMAALAKQEEDDTGSVASSAGSIEHHALRIPMDDEVVVPDDGRLEEQAMSDERLLDATPTTIDSHTDCEINTSQVDSSALEDLPLNRGSRKRATLATGEQTRGETFRQKFHDQAGRLRTKLRGIKKPNMHMRRNKPTASSDRPVSTIDRKKTEKPRFTMPKMPARPKLKMPDISMPKMPERPKISMPKMPDRPKISMPKMPDRPKISMPKMPDRPKISMPKMPDRPKISMPKMPERPKISMPKMPDRPKISMPKMPDRPKISMPKMPTLNLSKKAEEQKASKTTESDEREEMSSTSDTVHKKRAFDFRTYPRIFERNKKTKVSTSISTSSPDQESKGTFFSTVPEWVTMPRLKKKLGSIGQRTHKLTDISKITEKQQQQQPQQPRSYPITKQQSEESSDAPEENIEVMRICLNPNKERYDEEHEKYNEEQIIQSTDEDEIDERDDILKNSALDQTVGYEEIKRPLHVNDAPSGESLNPDSTQEERSNVSSERGGVIEEINADEFFVREKGISQENIEVSAYISSEIRDAFQTPANALSQMTDIYPTDDFTDDQADADVDESYKESPVERPPRRKKRRDSNNSDVLIQEIEENQELNHSQEINEILKRGGKEWSEEVEENQDIKNIHEEILTQTAPPRPTRSRKSSESKHSIQNFESFGEFEVDEEHLEQRRSKSNEHIAQDSPMPPLRRKRSLKSNTVSQQSLPPVQDINEIVDMKNHFIEDQSQEIHSISEPEIQADDSIVSSPVAVKRQLRSSHSRSTVDEDRTSHGADSLMFDEIPREISDEEAVQLDVLNVQVPDVLDMSAPPGYSVVNKRTQQTLPPPRTKRKKKRGTQFFTVPRRLKDHSPPPPPVRPVRAYSTLRTSRRSRENKENKENDATDDSTQYIEIDDDESATRNLHSGEVIEKMKSRPLPAPPRPPRKTRSHSTENILKEINISNVENVPIRFNLDRDESILKRDVKPLENIINVDVEPIEHEDDIIIDDIKPIEEVIQEVEIQNQINLEQQIPVSSLDEYIEEEIPKSNINENIQEVDVSSNVFVHVAQTHIPDNTVIEVETYTQTDPLPDDFCCDEVIEEPTDIILAPTRRRKSSQQKDTGTNQSVRNSLNISDPSTEPETVFEAKEDFDVLQEPSQSSSVKHDEHPPISSEQQPSTSIPIMMPETLKIDRLQVGDLDVERLSVSELLANKILVSEMDGMSFKVNELSSNSGNLVVDGIELSSQFWQQIFDKLPSVLQEHFSASDADFVNASKSSGESKKVSTADRSTSIDDTKLEDTEATKTSVNPTTESLPQEQENICENIESPICKESVQNNETENVHEDFVKQSEPEQVVSDADALKTLETKTETEEQSQETQETDNLPKQSETRTDTEQLPSDNTQPQTRAPPRRKRSSAHDTKLPKQQSTTEQPAPPLVSYILPENVPGLPYPHIYVLPQPFCPSGNTASGGFTEQSQEPTAGPSSASEPSIPDITAELFRACSSSANRTVRQLLMQISSYLNRTGDGKQDTKTALTIIIILIAGLILLGMGGGGETVHHHHWEFFNPPNGGGRPQ